MAVQLVGQSIKKARERLAGRTPTGVKISLRLTNVGETMPNKTKITSKIMCGCGHCPPGLGAKGHALILILQIRWLR